MERQARKKEVEANLKELLGQLRPTDSEKNIQFERRVATALRGVLKKRLRVNFLKARWLKDAIKERFQKCKVTLEFYFSQKIDLNKYQNVNMHLYFKGDFLVK